MSKKRPYEEIDQQFSDLPIPEQEASWQKMKKLLEDNDDDNIAPPPVFFKSCLGWGLLLVGLIATWLIVRPEKWWSEESKTEQTSTTFPIKKSEPAKEENAFKRSVPSKTSAKKKESNNVIVTESTIAKSSNPFLPGQPNKIASQPTTKKSSLVQTRSRNAVSQKSDSASSRIHKGNNVITASEQPHRNEKTTGINTQNEQPVNTNSVVPEKSQVPDSITKAIATPIDSVGQKKLVDSSTQRKSFDSTIQKEQPKKKFAFAAGIGEQQLIPIAGQTTVPYSHYGRKGSLADYVPSVFVRLQKEKKWFVQGEFRYGAAQSVKEFSFARKTTFDSSSSSVTTKTQRLKKTYYHQLPLSFNYYLQPNLSIGIGGMYSRFYRAVTEQETKTQNALTGTEVVVKKIIPIKHFTDSFLYKTQVHVLLQADYYWKRFSFGLRYTKDVQPYIKYTKPDGTVDEEKNQSLQFIIRYRLWQSGQL